jgi:hypothetical protein
VTIDPTGGDVPPNTYSTHPPTARWTHVALRVNDIDATIEWYTTHTPLTLLARREDPDGYGAWLGHRDNVDHPFLLVVSQFFEGHDPFGDSAHTVLGRLLIWESNCVAGRTSTRLLPPQRPTGASPCRRLRCHHQSATSA